MTAAEDFICFRANTTTPANRQKALPAYDWQATTTTATKTSCCLSESEMDLDGPPPPRGVAAGTLGRLGSSNNGSSRNRNCIDLIDQNNNPRDHGDPQLNDDGGQGIAISTTGFTTINKTKTEEKQDSSSTSYSIAVPERARRCRSMDRHLTQHDDQPPPLRALHSSPQQAAASSSSLLLSDSSMDHPDDEGEEFIQAIGRRKPYPPPPLPPPPPPNHPNHLLRSAASWDELDSSSSKKRSSTRKHAHFASHHHNSNGDLHDSEDDPTSSLLAARQHSSSCKKPRGTPLRKSIFTPIKREAAAAVKPSQGENDDDDEREDDDDNLLLLDNDQHDHHLPWEISAATTTPAGVLPATTTAVKTTSNKQNKKLNKRSFGTVTTTATSSTSATTHFGDESTDHSVDSTGTTSNFRFTSFPASLPRIHQQPYHHQHQQQQQQHHYHNHPASAAATVMVPNHITNLHGSYTMMESDCVDHHHHHNNHHHHHNTNNDYNAYCYSGDDHTAADDSSTVASSMYGTPVARLTFASAMERAGAPAPCLDLPDSSHNPHDPPASFASSVSSIAKNNVSACDNEVNTESTAALTPTRGLGGIGGGGSCNALLLMDDDPGTPREVEVHFHMPNCSPIPPGIPEGCNESSISSSRPMPDSHAFDEDGDDDDDEDDDDDDDTTTPHNSSTESQVPALPHLRPPPTPIRIPTWSSHSAFGRPQQKKLIRSNSLLATKVLASDVATNDLFPEVMTLSGSFRIIGSPLGKGVFADVCKVQSKTDERYYALKCQRQAFRGRKDRDMALAEVRCMLILQKDPPLSPYLLRFFKAWQEDERIHVVTELCCKDTCRQLLDKHPVLPEGVIWKLVYDVSSGLAHMHARKLVHNDIKPSNILLERHESLGAICKIGDFGMTRPVDSTDDGQEGDQKYMALELLHKTKLQASADVFSLGLTIYEAASETLVVPSHGPLWRQLRNGQHSFYFGPNNNSGDHHHRSVELQDLIRRMMHPDATQRPATASIVDLVPARDAGTLYNRFLADYIGTVEDQELALDENDVDRGGGGREDHNEGPDDGDNEYQTPRNMRSLCSPPPPPPPGQCGGLTAPSSFLFSSPQA